MQQITQHQNYIRMAEKVTETRAAIAGEFFVKELREALLPHMSDIDTTSESAKQRYEIYLANAEYDNYPGKTMHSLVGRMKFDASNVGLPDRISYLEESADGDGLSIRGMMQDCAKEVLQVKWCVFVADYQGLSDVAIDELSLADARELKPRASIKAYTRENVVNWHYSRINGVMQLSYIMLRELGSEFSAVTGERKAIESYLVLALDDDGAYYQQKIVKSAGGYSVGEQSYMTVAGSALNWLPVIIASDEEIRAGELPIELGYLSPICDSALYRYRMSAEYKETIRNLPPTTYVKGATTMDWENFKEANGRDYLLTGSGSVNILFGDMDVDVKGANTAIEPYERFFERNTEQAKQLGAVMQGQTVAATATEAEISAAEQNAQLQMLAQNIESAFKRLCLYCLMFEGALSPDAIEQGMDLVTIAIPRDFAKSKLTPEETSQIAALFIQGIVTREVAIDMLIKGGIIDADAELLLSETNEI
jgi:hypothetical protein